MRVQVSRAVPLTTLYATLFLEEIAAERGMQVWEAQPANAQIGSLLREIWERFWGRQGWPSHLKNGYRIFAKRIESTDMCSRVFQQSNSKYQELV